MCSQTRRRVDETIESHGRPCLPCAILVPCPSPPRRLRTGAAMMIRHIDHLQPAGPPLRRARPLVACVWQPTCIVLLDAHRQPHLADSLEAVMMRRGCPRTPPPPLPGRPQGAGRAPLACCRLSAFASPVSSVSPRADVLSDRTSPHLGQKSWKKVVVGGKRLTAWWTMFSVDLHAPRAVHGRESGIRHGPDPTQAIRPITSSHHPRVTPESVLCCVIDPMQYDAHHWIALDASRLLPRPSRPVRFISRVGPIVEPLASLSDMVRTPCLPYPPPLLFSHVGEIPHRDQMITISMPSCWRQRRRRRRRQLRDRAH
ncbi:hypothetical protein LZ30DRAFT_156993 [Colletotrichum cereale]|nr:hypothetical protein LZ30DRAFT_156993 [Colletotrichum cereale]